MAQTSRNIFPDSVHFMFLDISGWLVMSTVSFVWGITILIGWALLLAWSTGDIVDYNDNPADFAQLIYFSGMSLLTLGTGDFVPSPDYPTM